MTVYVVRHGDAEPRDRWTGTDVDRPLTGRGVKEAQALVDRFDTGPLGARLRDFDAPRPEPKPTLLLSSSAERCLATLRPLARRLWAARSRPPTSSPEGSDAGNVLSRVKELAWPATVCRCCAPTATSSGRSSSCSRPRECPSPARWT